MITAISNQGLVSLMATKITKRMVKLARKFEQAASDAGFEYARIMYGSADWVHGEKPVLTVHGVCKHNKTHDWRKGE